MRKLPIILVVFAFCISVLNAQWFYNEMHIVFPLDTMDIEELGFGTSRDATDGFDNRIDLAHPPCPPSGPCAYFSIDDALVMALSEDIRAMTDTVTWGIFITFGGGMPHEGYITWNPEGLPSYPGCSLFVKVHYPPIATDFSDAVDMRLNDSLPIAPAQMISIRFFTIDAVEEKENLPTETGIASVTPNPFNSTSKITFRAANEGSGRIDIMDVNGRIVKNLLSGSYPKGTWEMAWDGTDNAGSSLNSGVYFVRFRSETGIFSEKIMLMK